MSTLPHHRPGGGDLWCTDDLHLGAHRCLDTDGSGMAFGLTSDLGQGSAVVAWSRKKMSEGSTRYVAEDVFWFRISMAFGPHPQ
jgi:hypothetical protein